MEWIVVWGVTAILASIAGGIIASRKNRDYSVWMAWCFVLPPVLIWLLLMPMNKGPARRRPTLDELDRADGGF